MVKSIVCTVLALLALFLSVAPSTQCNVLYVYHCSDTLLSSEEGVQANRLRGSGVYKINLYKNLKKHGIHPVIILADDFDLKRDFEEHGACCYEIALLGHKGKKNELAELMLEVCKKDNIELIHCNSTFEIDVAKEVAKLYPVSIVATLHTDNLYEHASLRSLDGILGVGSTSLQALKQANRKRGFGIKHMEWIPPFYDEQRFLNTRITRTREQFFVEQFGMKLSQNPTVCMIANFYPCFKNHDVVLQAAQKLKRDYQCPINVIFAGTGPKMDTIKKRAQALGLSSATFFLGNVPNDKVPELLFHSDVEVLMSSPEACGIVLLEGALMKKPLIGTRGTGMEAVVKHEKTGLLCGVRDADTLARQIFFLLNNPKKAREFGQSAYDFVTQTLSMDAGIEKLKGFYYKILGSC